MRQTKRKKSRGMAVIAACLLLGNGAAVAGQGDLYLSIDAMYVSGADQRDDINNKLDSQGLNASVAEYSDSRYGWNVSGFFQLASKWGVELGYVDLGDVSLRIDGVAADVDSFLNSITDLRPVTANGATLALVGQYNVAHNITLQIKGGVFFWRSSYDLQGANTTKHVSAQGTDGTYGLQLSTEIVPRIQANMGLQAYTVEGQLNKTIGLGLTYRLPVLSAEKMKQLFPW